MHKSRTFLSMVTASFLSLPVLLCPLTVSCNGNGCATDIDGDTYTSWGGYMKIIQEKMAARAA